MKKLTKKQVRAGMIFEFAKNNNGDLYNVARIIDDGSTDYLQYLTLKDYGSDFFVPKLNIFKGAQVIIVAPPSQYSGKNKIAFLIKEEDVDGKVTSYLVETFWQFFKSDTICLDDLTDVETPESISQ